MRRNLQKLFYGLGLIVCINSNQVLGQATLVSQFDFNGNVNDKLSVSTASLYNNANTAYINGALTWTANTSAGGGGLIVDVPDASFTESDYSISMDVKFSTVTGYRKLIDFFNMVDDDGFYFLNNNLTLYLGGNALGTSVVSAQTYYTILMTRTGIDDTARAYLVQNNMILFECKRKDTPGKYIPTLIGTDRKLGFFHDDGGGEYPDSGAVRSIRIWNGTVNINQVCNGVANYTASPSSLNVCTGSSKTFTFGTSPDPAFTTYTFNPLGTTTPTAIISPTANTVYSLQGDYYSTSCFTPSTGISVTVVPNPTVTAVSSSTMLCQSNTASLTASGALAYVWSTSSTNTVLAVTPSITTNYTVVGTDANGCTAFSTITQSVAANPTVTAVSSKTMLCQTNTVSLTAIGALTYTWNTASTNTVIVVSPSVTTNYTVTGTNSFGCTGSTIITQSVSANPTVTAVTSSSIICGPLFQQTATLTANGASTYTWNTSSTNTVIAVSPSVTTSYTVTGSNSVGCTGSIVITQSVSTCTDIQSMGINNSSYAGIFPNPNNGRFHVSLNNLTDNTFIEVYNTLGQLIHSVKADELNEDIEFSNQPNGIYIVKVLNNNSQIFVTKIIKE